jgi:hypothetical protein
LEKNHHQSKRNACMISASNASDISISKSSITPEHLEDGSSSITYVGGASRSLCRCAARFRGCRAGCTLSEAAIQFVQQQQPISTHFLWHSVNPHTTR